MLQNATSLVRAVLLGTLLTGGPLHAASLSVTPTKVDVAPNSNQTTMTIKSGGRGTSVVQVRIFRWNERHDPSRLSQTRDVAVSPPMVQLNGRQELTVRIVRTTGRRVRGRECYRVLVDRLRSQGRPTSQIGLRIRHSVPVCFTG